MTIASASPTRQHPHDPGTPGAVVAGHSAEDDLTRAVKHLEHEHYGMDSISVLGTTCPGPSLRPAPRRAEPWSPS